MIDSNILPVLLKKQSETYLFVIYRNFGATHHLYSRYSQRCINSNFSGDQYHSVVRRMC